MSYAVNQPMSPGRPSIVTASGILLFVASAALLGQAIVQFLMIGPVGRELEPLYAPFGDPGAGGSVAKSMFGFTGGGALIFTVIFGVLGALDLAGRNAARICTWIFGGLGMLCCGCTSTLFATFGINGIAGQLQEQATDAQEPGPSQVEFVSALDRGIPDWYTPVLLGLAAVMVLALLVAMILLTLPGAGQFFKKAPITWVPPTAGTWPGQGMPTGGTTPGGWSGYGPPPTTLPNRPDRPETTPPPPGGAEPPDQDQPKQPNQQDQQDPPKQ